MFGNLGTTEMLVIFVVALLLFGKRLPEVGRSLGKAFGEFKRGLRGIEDELKGEIFSDAPGRPGPAAPPSPVPPFPPFPAPPPATAKPAAPVPAPAPPPATPATPAAPPGPREEVRS
ncbi:MAG: twin-arginine translocase TatA/TatE family subunit [Planctomycetes bacterium]|nr:twin-arginine translocase TatA/TatE family subunit [Planctomycetota bacterium]